MSGDLLGSPKPKEMAAGGLADRRRWRPNTSEAAAAVASDAVRAVAGAADSRHAWPEGAAGERRGWRAGVCGVAGACGHNKHQRIGQWHGLLMPQR